MFFTDGDPSEPQDTLTEQGISSFDEMSPTLQAAILADCAAFQVANAANLDEADDSQAGHDFWLTRQGHGTGFWDRGDGVYGSAAKRDALDAAARKVGEFYGHQ